MYDSFKKDREEKEVIDFLKENVQIFPSFDTKQGVTNSCMWGFFIRESATFLINYKVRTILIKCPPIIARH